MAEQPRTPPTQHGANGSDASVRRVFGAELRYRREQRGLSQAALAQLVNFDRSLIGKVEKAERVPTRELARLCDRALRTGGALLRLWEFVDAERRGDGRPPGSGQPAAPPAANGSAAVPMPPDAFLERVGGDVVGFLHRTLLEYARADNLLGPRHLAATVGAQFLLVEQLRRRSSGQTHAELLRAGARFAELASWLHQDAGAPVAASVWADRSMEWAQAAHEEPMVTYVLIRKSTQALAAGDTHRGVSLAEAARRAALGGPAAALTLAALQQANAEASHGEAGRCARALAEAAAAAARHATDVAGGADGTDAVAARYCSLELYVQIKAAVCDAELGRHRRAAEAFGELLARLPLHHRRDRGQYLARLAGVHARAGHPDGACAAASEALPIARACGSVRTLQDLAAVPVQLARWRDVPDVRDLREQIDAALAEVGTNSA